MAAPSPPRSATPPTSAAAAAAAAAPLETEQDQDQAAEPGILYAAIPTSDTFSDALMEHILSLPADAAIPISAKPTRAAAAAAAAAALETETAPHPPPSALPLPLTSPLRTHKSALPDVLVTHPGGWLEGSAAPQSVIAAFTDDWLAAAEESGRTGPRQMVSDVNGEVARQLDVLRRRMAERRAARDENERIDKEIRGLQAERDMELRVIEETRRRREQARA